MNLHFIGMGKMGLPMASHLKRAGHAVTVSDIAPDRVALAAREGLAVVDPASVLPTADVAMSSLPNDVALVEVAQQLAQHARAGCIWVDTSTVSLEASQKAATLCEPDLHVIRATVSGNNHMAEAAQLTVMASGPRPAYDQILPLLQCLGPHHFYLGQAEEARLMKLVINLMIAQTSAMLAEALTLGSKGGLKWSDLWDVLNASAVASPILKAKSVQLKQRDFTPTFTVDQMLKDLSLILGAGHQVGVPLTQTALTQSLMQAAKTQGLSLEDYACIIKVVERAAQVKVNT